MGDKAYARVRSGRNFASQDATGTPLKSPLTVTDTVATIIVPDNATEMVITSVDNDLRVSEVVGIDPYVVYPAASTIFMRLPVSGMTNVFLQRDGASNAVTNFYFNIG